jgi:hypothetical protein
MLFWTMYDEKSKDYNDSKMGYNEGLVSIVQYGWIKVVLMVYLWKKRWLFDYVEEHKYKLFQILYSNRFENYLGGLMGQECRHIFR